MTATHVNGTGSPPPRGKKHRAKAVGAAIKVAMSAEGFEAALDDLMANVAPEMLRQNPELDDHAIGDRVADRLAAAAAAAERVLDGEAWPAPEPGPQAALGVADALCAETWMAREFAPPLRLLGDLVTATTRAFLVGATGLGKTMLGIAMAAGMATGAGFLEWTCDRPVKVLYLDGEMPGELVKARLQEAVRHLGRSDAMRNLFVYSTDDAEQFAKLFPQLGELQPLNTPDGQAFVHRLVDALGGVDAIIFDNVMSLVTGDQREELGWSATLPLVTSLTRRRIGQLWLDHAGHAKDRQYGSSTKSWRFDTVGLMTELPEEQQVERETAFKLTFTKARRRTPENWAQFAPCVIRLADNRWSAEPEGGGAALKGKVSPSRAVFHKALLSATTASCAGPGAATAEEWETACVRQGLLEEPEPNEASKAKGRRLAKLRTARLELVAARWIQVSDHIVRDLTKQYA